MKLMMSILGCAAIVLPAAAIAQTGAATLTDQAEKLVSSGQRSEALALYRQAVKQDPASFDAQIGIGRLLDLEGQYAEARQHLQKAIEIAPEADRNAALSTMAQSYAFEGNAAEAAKYYQRVFDGQVKASALEGAAGTANALGRVYLETGDVTNAEKWYRVGYDTSGKPVGMEKPTPENTDLWEMRWQHAQARIAARRKQFDVAHRHMDEVRTIIGRGRLAENQRIQYPYLAGYVAFYEGKPDEAIAELSKASQDDPFVLSLLAQAYEQKKDQAKARELWTRIVAMSDHNLQMAFARPLAQRRLR
jgi:tetratricopeptide (TPR) repeat protein